MTEQIRVMIADDQWLVREGIASLLELEVGINVIAMVSSGQEAVAEGLTQKPDIILMDIRMPEMTGIEATAKIRQALPTCQIVMLTTFDDEEYIVQSLLAGACGYLMKDIPPGDLARAIKLAHAGVFQLAPDVAGKLIGSLQDIQPKPKPEEKTLDLTPRELEVLKLVAKGATNKEIARQFEVSEGTIKNHVSNILMRLELRDRTQAAVYAVEQGLI
ncbi:MAG: response regulator transcription factor [Trueperaceae bacterium]|nr:response regulator transcription factor [Trueperaceae bacterium]